MTRSIATIVFTVLLLLEQPAAAHSAWIRATSTESTMLLEPQTEPEPSTAHGILGPIRFGPIVGTGLPNILNFGILVKVARYFGMGANIGLIPTLRVSYYGDATLSFREYDFFARLYPFGGGFFLGTGLGYATVKGNLTGQLDTSPYVNQVPPNVTVPNPLTYASRGFVRTMVLTPHLGYCYTMDIGFAIGGDIGAQVPVAPSSVAFESQLLLPPDTPVQVVGAARSQLLEPNDQKVRNSLEKLGRTPIPALNIWVGWMF